MKLPYSFGLVRYVHDVVSGEFANVGVVVFAPDARFLGARCTRRYGRLSSMFGTVNGSSFRYMMAYLEARARMLHERLSEFDFGGRPEGIREALNSILPPDDSSVQLVVVGGGVTEAPSEALDALFERFVGRFEEATAARGRGDVEVWGVYKSRLAERNVLSRLEPLPVHAPLLTYTFEHAWKNGVWNALEPVSLDLTSPDSILDKANKWLGRAVNLSEGDRELKVHFLLGRPQDRALRAAYDRAKDIIHKAPLSHALIEEDEAADFAEDLRGKMEDAEG